MYVMPTPLSFMKSASWYPDSDRAKAIYAESLDKVAMAAKSVMHSINKLYDYANDSLISGEVVNNGEKVFCVTVPQEIKIFDPATTKTRLSIRDRLEKAVEYFKQEYGTSCIIRDWLNYTDERKLLQDKVAELQERLFSEQYKDTSSIIDKDIINIDNIFTSLCREVNK